MSKPPVRQDEKAPGHYGNQGPPEPATSPSQPDREERHQRTRELAPTDQVRQSEGMPPGGSASAAGPAEGNPADRETDSQARKRETADKSEHHRDRAAQNQNRDEVERHGRGKSKRG